MRLALELQVRLIPLDYIARDEALYCHMLSLRQKNNPRLRESHDGCGTNNINNTYIVTALMARSYRTVAWLVTHKPPCT